MKNWEMITTNEGLLDDIFGGILNEFQGLLNKKRSTGLSALIDKESYPRLNLTEEDGCLRVDATVPGLSKEDVSVEVDEDLLVISGGKTDSSQSETSGKVIRKEIKTSKFQRSIRLNKAELDLDSISASVENGLLTVKIPKLTKKVESASRKILIS